MYTANIPLYHNQVRQMRKPLQNCFGISWEELALMTDNEVEENLSSLGYTLVRTASAGDDTLYVVPKDLLENAFVLNR
jgi:hypothetical protein